MDEAPEVPDSKTVTDVDPFVREITRRVERLLKRRDELTEKIKLIDATVEALKGDPKQAAEWLKKLSV